MGIYRSRNETIVLCGVGGSDTRLLAATAEHHPSRNRVASDANPPRWEKNYTRRRIAGTTGRRAYGTVGPTGAPEAHAGDPVKNRVGFEPPEVTRFRAAIAAGAFRGVPGYRPDRIFITNLQPWLERLAAATDPESIAKLWIMADERLPVGSTG